MAGPIPLIVGGIALLAGAIYRGGEGDRLDAALKGGEIEVIDRAYAYALRRNDRDMLDTIACLILTTGCCNPRFVIKGRYYGWPLRWNPDAFAYEEYANNIPMGGRQVYLEWDGHSGNAPGIPLQWDVSTQRLFAADVLERYGGEWQGVMVSGADRGLLQDAIDGAREWAAQEISYKQLKGISARVQVAGNRAYTRGPDNPAAVRMIHLSAAAHWATMPIGVHDEGHSNRGIGGGAAASMRGALRPEERDEARAWMVDRAHAYMCRHISGVIVDPRLQRFGETFEAAVREERDKRRLARLNPDERYAELLERLTEANGRRRTRIIREPALRMLIRDVAKTGQGEYEFIKNEIGDRGATEALAVRVPRGVLVDISYTEGHVEAIFDPIFRGIWAWGGQREEEMVEVWKGGGSRIFLPLSFVRGLS